MLQEEKASTKGSDWYDMKAPELTEELEADIEALQMRGALSSWTGYKKSDYKKGPKYFQVPLYTRLHHCVSVCENES